MAIDWYDGKIKEVAQRHGVSVSTVLKRRAEQRGYRKKCYLPGERTRQLKFSLPVSQVQQIERLAEEQRTSVPLLLQEIVQSWLIRQV